MKTINIALLGFGNVGKAFARLLTAKKQELQEHFGFNARITAIATGSHGVCLDPNGIDEQNLLNLLDSVETLELSGLDKMD